MANTNASAYNGFPNTMQTTSTFKMFPVADGITPFRGESTTERPYDFLRSCEDVMQRSIIADDNKKISFVMSKLAGEARYLVYNSSAFSTRVIGNSYAEFRKNFLTVFGGKKETDLISYYCCTSDKIHAESQSMYEMRAWVEAHQTVTDYISVLDYNGWFQNDTMSRKDFRRLMEFKYFMIYVNKDVKRNLGYLRFRPGDEVADLAAAAKENRDQISSYSETEPSLVALLTDYGQSQSCVTTFAKPGNLCTYCNRIGHTDKRCYKKKKDQKLISSKSDADNTQKRSILSVRPKTSTASQGSTGKAKSHEESHKAYCLIHGRCRHSSEQCRDIIKLKIDRQARANQYTSKQSGEDQRTPTQRPG